MWGKIIIPMYRLWLNGLYGLYGPRCPLSSKRPINLISLSLFPRDLGLTYDQKWPNSRLLGSWSARSYIAPMLLTRRSWDTPEYSQQLGPTRHWNRHAPRPLLTVKNGRGTCQFHLRVTQLAAGSPFGRKSVQIGRNSLDGIVSARP